MTRVVLKFGGTSVASRDRWERIGEIASDRLKSSDSVLIVASAVSGVSNILEALPDAALRDEAAEPLQALRQKHEDLARELEISLDDTGVSALLDLAERLCMGTTLLGEMTPRLRAKMLSLGELMSTKMGAAFLSQNGLQTTWLDARELLPSTSRPNVRERDRFLSAVVAPEYDEALVKALDAAGPVALIQGFLAKDAEGQTVVLGRGGSDTSAALFAARSQADRCEIWTDVPGMFTANPRDVPSARLIKHLSYDEAQEIASMGAKVLHPRSIDPVRRMGIPMWVKSSLNPELPGTCIGEPLKNDRPEVKALSLKTGIQLISMETVGMWQNVGFLADAFAVFKKHGISIDLISTSETNVTVSLDAKANALGLDLIERLLEDLRPYCRPQAIGPVAAVSLVGHHIRGLLHRLGPALEVFEEQKIHLLSQASSDLNLTVVVDETQALRLLSSLHRQLIGPRLPDDEVLGPTWDELFEPEAAKIEAADASGARFEAEAWYHHRRDELLAVAAEATPVYVYNPDVVVERAKALLALENVDRVLYAMKANASEAFLKPLVELGVGLETVSPGELTRARALMPKDGAAPILYTPNFAPRSDYEQALEADMLTTLDNLHPLSHWPELFSGKSVVLRLDPGQGRGHHAHVRTAGSESKFGIAEGQLEEAKRLIDAAGAEVVGLHAHVGSGLLDPTAWQATASYLAHKAEIFGKVRFIDVGGGLGVPYRADQLPLDLAALDASLLPVKKAFPDLEIWMEPGRYLVAEAGVLLAKVTQLKEKGAAKWVGVDAGMNSLLRPALYGAYHHVVNLTRPEAPHELVHVVGPICETGDTLGWGRQISQPEEGDVLLVNTAGAYGRVMASHYNLREPAREVALPMRG